MTLCPYSGFLSPLKDEAAFSAADPFVISLLSVTWF